MTYDEWKTTPPDEHADCGMRPCCGVHDCDPCDCDTEPRQGGLMIRVQLDPVMLHDSLHWRFTPLCEPSRNALRVAADRTQDPLLRHEDGTIIALDKPAVSLARTLRSRGVVVGDQPCSEEILELVGVQ